MKSLLIALFVTVSLCLGVSQVHATENPQDIPNNKFGIHILDKSELEPASKLVNSSGGEWGYVTIPIQPTDRDKDAWQAFMDKAKKLKITPILRITTIPLGGTWQEGRDTDLVDFANFLGDLSWPVKNRYIIIFNEVNRSTEWGGQVDPVKYTRILKNARTIFKERSSDFFILAAGLDNALSKSTTSMRAPDYLSAMQREDPLVFSYIDGWNSHSYANPEFSASPTKTGWTSIVSYLTEQSYVKIAPKPVFITETGWINTRLGETKRSQYLESALKTWANDSQVVAVTPFLLQAGAGDFVPFSFLDQDGQPTASYRALESFPKVKGEPTQNDESAKPSFATRPAENQSSNAPPLFRPMTALLKLENLFRKIFGLTTKHHLQVGSQFIEVAIADNPKLWEKGLSGQPELALGTGMYFVFPKLHIPMFWMKDMLFPIDIIWIKDKEIIDFTLNAPIPESGTPLPNYSPKAPINRVLEVPAGFVETYNLRIGDQVELIN